MQKETKTYEKVLEQGFLDAKAVQGIRGRDWIDSPWPPSFFEGRDLMACAPTAVTEDVLQRIAEKVSEIPEGFHVHSGISLSHTPKLLLQ